MRSMSLLLNNRLIARRANMEVMVASSVGAVDPEVEVEAEAEVGLMALRGPRGAVGGLLCPD